MFFSVIIPSLNINKDLKKTLNNLSNQNFKKFEVIIVSENNFRDELKDYDLNINFIFDQKILNPGEKRNLGSKKSVGKYLAFIDDDAYPAPTWLNEAFGYLKNNENEKICLGGPGINPIDNNIFSESVNLFFTSSLFHSDNYRYKKILNLDNKEMQDWPSVNFIINKDYYENLGGFNIKYWPGEDSKLCKKVLDTGGKILYKPNMFVFHHNRANITKHIKQIFRYGLHRGIFFKNMDNNSFKIKYLIPSLFLISHLSFFISENIFYYIISFYFSILLLESFLIKNVLKILPAFVISRFIVYLSHISYGLGFLVGIFNKNYKPNLYR